MITPGEGPPAAAAWDFALFLAEASEVLASSLDYQATLSSVADLVVSNLADWCAIDMLDEDGSMQQLAVTHKDPVKGAWARELRRRYPSDPDAPRGVPQVLRSGEPEFYRQVTDEMLVAAARDAEHLRILREVGFTSVMILPLVARGRTLGAITLVLAESGRRYEDGDLALAEDLARRAALAVDNARLYREAQEEIAERKRTEQTLRQSRRRYRDLVNSLEGIVWEADARTVEFSFVSEQAERLLGYSSSRWVSETTFWRDHIHPDDREWVISFSAEATAQRRYHELEYRMVAADGRTVWLRDIVTVVVEEEEPVRLRGVMVDITERKRAEHDLRASEERLSRIVETNADGIVMVDREGRITFANVAAERIFGLARDSITARTYDDPKWKITTADGGSLPEEGLPFARVLRTEESVYGVELALERPDGSRVILSVNGAPLRDAEGNVTGMVASFGDVTERKRSEEELRKREAISEAVRFAAERLLRQTGTWEEGVQEVLERLGEATGVSRVYVFENYTTDDGEVWATNTHEWVAQGISAQIDNPTLQALPYKAPGFSRWAEVFARGETRYGHVRNLPEVERPEPEAEGTLSYVLVPVFVEGAWWGFMGFDECVAERDFSATELDALKAAADNLGAAIGRKQAEEKLRESQRTLATLMSNLPGMAYRCRNDPEWTMEFVSEGSSELTGYLPDDLVGNRRVAYAGLIHPDDREMVWEEVETALDERRSFQLTYRITAVEGELKWVWEQGRGVFSTEEELIAVEGFVTDTTERAQAMQLLEQRVQERTRELSALLEVSNNVASTLELEPLLDLILDQLGTMVDYADSSLLVLEGDELVTVGYRGSVPREQVLGTRFLPGHGEVIWAEFRNLEYVIIDDVWDDTPLARSYREVIGEERLRTEFGHVRSWLGLPLALKDRSIGLLALIHDEPDHFTNEHAELARTIANQAAVAIENARLYEQAQSAAALKERQHLARELHDSVSQALYGIALGARTARTWLDRDPTRVAAPLDYVLSLSEAGMAEMRALIFELRPESLESEGLVAALEKQAAALRARHGLEVRVDLCEEPDVPLEVKETVYRVAQEALHNAIKHAGADTVSLRLQCDAEGIVLEISDDGAGFDPSDSFPGHLGLKSMRERAGRLGGVLQVEGALGEGVHLHLQVPLD